MHPTRVPVFEGMTPRRVDMPMCGARIHLLGLLALLVWGCADDDTPSGPCDARFVVCQEHLAREVSIARGGPRVELPPVEVITEAELRQRYSDEMMEPTPAEARELDLWGRALMLLRLVDSPAALTTGSLEDFFTNVAGFYDPATGSITIVDRGVPVSLSDATYVFAHELTHRAQDVDQTAGFAAHEGLADSLDGVDALAHHGEGEAVVVGNLVLTSLRGDELSAQDWRDYFAEWLAAERAAVVSTGDPFIAVRSRLKYVVGGAYLMDAWLAGGSDGLREQWNPGILQTASWMRGYDSRIAAAAFLECEFPRAPTGYTAWTNERLGGELLFPMLVPDGQTAETYLEGSWTSAMGWRGDHLRVFVATSPAEPVAVAYRVRAAGVDEARDIAARLRAAQAEDVVVYEDAADVLLLVSAEPGVWDSWSYPAGCFNLPMGVSPVRMHALADRLPVTGIVRRQP